jgi:N-sulfoglucosamine sulfohydrolase
MRFARRCFCLTAVLGMLVSLRPARCADRPNIVWLSCEDISPHIGCYGDPHAITPHIDRLAAEGVRYTHCYTTAGVCAPCRSGIITGMYQSSLGTHHMRCNASLPQRIQPFPMYLRKAGYYCTNNSKTDYQFRAPKETWDESSRKAHWRNRKDRTQPFFSVFNFTGCHESGIAGESKYRSVTEKLAPEQRQTAAELTTLPPYYPDTPVTREDWKRNYELITAMDAWAGELVAQLKQDGLYEDTVIMFWSDHGVGLPRAKRWLYESGTHVPLVVRTGDRVRVPGQGRPGLVSRWLISSIDFGPTVLNLAGVKVPDHMQGRAFLGRNLPKPRRYVYGARDRMDERYDIIRMVRDERYRYIRNYEPNKTFYQYMNTPEKGATMKEIRRCAAEGKLPSAAALFMAPRKSVEELYDVAADPHEINNLAGDPACADVLVRMREAHLDWVEDSKDVGLIPEPELAVREKALGSRYAILRQDGGDALVAKIRAIAPLAGECDTKHLPAFVAAMDDDDAAVRYWGAMGIGNLGNRGVPAVDLMSRALGDDSAVVRIAAARALCHMAQPDQALPLLARELHQGAQWERLHAAIVLDEIDGMAMPVVDAMKRALEYRKGFLAAGKYRVRVINRALNELLGTSNTVK